MKRSDLYLHDTGYTPWVVSRIDARFPWSLYIPTTAPEKTSAPLLVLVHDSTRYDYLRQGFRDFAEQTGTVLMAPLFPVSAAHPEDMDGYKWVDAYDVRYDLLLLDMIDQAADICPITTDRFALFGYSGGGQFVHRFMYLHPHRLSALSIGAPGNVTLPDLSRTWPAGVQDLEKRFGAVFDANVVQNIPVHLVVGGADTKARGIAKAPDDPVYIKGVNDEQTDRVTKLKLLAKELSDLGCSTHFDAVEGVAHDGMAMIPAVTQWLERTLANSISE